LNEEIMLIIEGMVSHKQERTIHQANIWKALKKTLRGRELDISNK